jgi:anthranilate synthase
VQAIGEYFGGQLGQLGQPAHGRPSRVQVRGGRLMHNLPNEIVIGRYHSLYVERDSMPDVLDVTASTEDGVAMAIEHKTLAVGGVQFHPESLMSLGGESACASWRTRSGLACPRIKDELRECVIARSGCYEAIQLCLPLLDCFATLAMTRNK